MTKTIKLLIPVMALVFFLNTFIIAGCSQSTNKSGDDEDLSFKIIDPSMLKDEKLLDWYNSSYKKRGSHSTSGENGYKYLIISGGEQPTGGYSMELVGNEKNNNSLIFYAKLNAPQKGQIVTQALTYPHLLIRIKAAERTTVKAQIDFPEKIAQSNQDHKSATGTFVGQIDNSSVEIIVDKSPLFPEGDELRVFRLSEQVKEFFNTNNTNYKGIEPNDKIKFDFRKNENGQLEIVNIEKLG